MAGPHQVGDLHDRLQLVRLPVVPGEGVRSVVHVDEVQVRPDVTLAERLRNGDLERERLRPIDPPLKIGIKAESCGVV